MKQYVIDGDKRYSIGELIEFLYKHETVTIESEERNSASSGWIVNKEVASLELIDALLEEKKKIEKTLK